MMKNSNSLLPDQPINHHESSKSECSNGGTSSESDFAFAFNDNNFSDRLLRIEAVNDPVYAPSNSHGATATTNANLARQSKRRRENVVDLVDSPDEHNLNLNQPDTDDDVANENQDKETYVLVGESPSGDEAANPNDSNRSMDNSAATVVRVKTLHISSPILASKSPFFYKLFSNGMRESEERHVTLRINASEEDALMELLNFMYSNTLKATAPSALLDVLMAADKFEVASCMRYCSRLLRNLPMTPESALLYLDLPHTILMTDAVQPLTDAAKQYLADRYKDITRFQEEVMALPLSGIEAILASDDLQVATEDIVFDFVLKWARHHYNRLEERQEVLATRLAPLIRFPCMSWRKLKKVFNCNEFQHEGAFNKLILESIFYKAETSHHQRLLAAEESSSLNRCFVERTYKYRPVKVVEFLLPQPQCVVYLDLKREECASLFPSGRMYSQAFHLGEQGFFLSAHCNVDQQNNSHCFGMFLGMQDKGTESFSVDYEFAARSRPTSEFVCKYKGSYSFTGGKAVGYRNLFGMPWSSFIAEDNIFFIKDVLYLRAEITIRQH